MYVDEINLLFGADKLIYWQVGTVVLMTLWVVSYMLELYIGKPVRRIFLIPFTLFFVLGWSVCYLYNMPLGDPLVLDIP